MKLITIFTECIKPVDQLLQLHDAIRSTNIRAARASWITKLFDCGVVHWPRRDSLWRISKNDLLIIGKKHNSTVREAIFKEEALATLLRSSLVLSMAAIDKILHEAILSRFELARTGQLDKLAHISISECYDIAIAARVRTGKGGKKVPRPGHDIKKAFLDVLYKDTFLSTSELQRICKICGKASIFKKYKESKSLTCDVDHLQNRWGTVYRRRNSIVHEADIIRKQKGQKVHLNLVNRIKDDIKFVRDFGEFLAIELEK